MRVTKVFLHITVHSFPTLLAVASVLDPLLGRVVNFINADPVVLARHLIAGLYFKLLAVFALVFVSTGAAVLTGGLTLRAIGIVLARIFIALNLF